MKYRDILQFEPITEIIQVGLLNDEDYRADVVKSFVYPDYFVETVIPFMVDNLKFSERNRKGIQIIGNYGSGKSHLMSLVSLIAEDRKYLDYVTSDKIKSILEPIAGNYMVNRFEMSQKKTLWDLITYQIQNFLDSNGVGYSFDPESRKMYSEQLSDMMAAFEEKYPEKGFLLVIDEMLVYLKGQAAEGRLDQELMVLQALGQQCSRGKFGFMFGVQEKIYNAKEFAFAAETLLKVKDRYIDLTIRRNDVSFVVQNRLLRKSEQQKIDIRKHLSKFRPYFSGLQSNFEEYVDLFPVHPSYLDNFENIKLDMAQREILKTLSSQFDKIKDLDIPTDNPGLITYDTYWDQMNSISAYKTYPDFKTVSDTVSIIYGKIETNFTGKRQKSQTLAKKFVNAAAIKILQGDLNKKNGISPETFVEDICPMSDMAQNRDFLVDIVASVATNIVKSTSGQYFDQNPDNNEFHIRTSGGINFDQKIIEYSESMSASQKDDAFFSFLKVVLGIENDSYRSGFRIYTHELEWRSHRVTREGYIFFGHPNERSTTHPKQHFYMIFMPIFQTEKKAMNNNPDEVYFVMDSLSDEFRSSIVLYGAAQSLWNEADSSIKPHYAGKKEDLFKRARNAFDKCYISDTEVYYSETGKRSLKSFQLPGDSATRMEVFEQVASDILEDYFCKETPQYPIFPFRSTNAIIKKDNKSRYFIGAFNKILRPTAGNMDGEAILSGLGCYKTGSLTISDSIYAQQILLMMNSREKNIVINRDEILEMLPRSENVWYSRDYHLDAEFEFLVLLVLVTLGACDITLNNGKQINASNIARLSPKELLENGEYYSFSNIKRPKDVNIPVLREIFIAFCGKDLTNRLDQEATFAMLGSSVQNLAHDCVEFEKWELKNGLKLGGEEVIDPVEAVQIKSRVVALGHFCDELSGFMSEATIKNYSRGLDTVQEMLKTKVEFEHTKEVIAIVKKIDPKISYLKQTNEYLPDDSKISKDIESTIDQLPCLISDLNKDAVDAYVKVLDDLKSRYINWYLEIYNRNCLAEIDEEVKVEILNSMEYKVCYELRKSALINTSDWSKWYAEFSQLKTADPNAASALQSFPTIGFNPIKDGNRDTRTIRQLRQDLKDIYSRWIDNLKDIVNSEESQKAIELMEAESQDFLNSFLQGMRQIDDRYSVAQLLRLLDDLTAGYEKVEISIDELAKCIPTPMTYDDAKDKIDDLLRQKCRGKDKNKVRIVIR